MKTIKSVEKAFHILSYVASHNGQKNLTEIGQALAMSPATLHGFLATLEDTGALARDAATGKYILGELIFKYSLVTNRLQELSMLCQPYLQAIRDQTKETVHLAIPYGLDQILYIARAESPHPFRLTSLVGTPEEASASALGYLLYPLPLPAGNDQIERRDDPAQPLCIKYEPELDAYCLATSFRYAAAENGQAGLSLVVPRTRFLAQDETFFTQPLFDGAAQIEARLQPKQA